MFDLETEIAKWKRSLTLAFGGPTPIADELESHLRDEFDRQITAGNTPEAALSMAVAKLGQPDRLAAEFIGIIPAKMWLPALICLIVPLSLISLQIWMATGSGVLSSVGWFWRVRLLLITIGYAMAFYSLVVGLTFVAFRAFRPFGVNQVRFVGGTMAWSNVVTAASLALSWAMSVFGVWLMGGGSLRQLSIPFGMGLTIVWFALMAGLWKLSVRHRQWSIPLSMFGATIVVWNWYFQLLWTIYHGSGSYGYGPPVAVVIALTLGAVIPILGFSVAMLPAAVLRRRTA